jgi:hypothetical protein
VIDIRRCRGDDHAQCADGLHVSQAEQVVDAQAKLEYARRIRLIEADDALSVDNDARLPGWTANAHS